MKKLIVSSVLVIMGLLTSVNAQEQKATVTNAFKPGWFIGANGGLNLFLGEGNNFFNPNKPFVSPTKNIGGLGRFALGYNFTPVVALRGMLGYNAYSWSTVPVGTPANLFSAENLLGDVVINLTNRAKGYDANRKIDFSIFAGLGMGFRNQNLNENSTPLTGIIRGGLQGDYHINTALALNMMLEANLATDNYNDLAQTPLPVDIFPALTLGLTYNLPEYVKKEKPAPVVKEPIIEPKKEEIVTPPVVQPPVVAEVKPVVPVVPPVVVPEKPAVAVVDTVKPVKVTPVAPVVVPTSPVTPPAVLLASELNEKIFFSINRAAVTNTKQKASIATIVDYMKQHPDATVTVSGFADASTGTVASNNAMSKNRAVSVANTLIKKYGIPYNHINVKWYGGGVQPYLVAAKNRLVIVKSPKTAVSAAPAKETAPVVAKPQETKTVAPAVTDEKDLYSVVNFAESKSGVVNAKQEEAIKKAGLFLQRHPDAIVRVSGYADNVYGAADYNNILSKKRATSVANELINKYGIKYERIQVKWFGGTKQHSTTPSLNRLVLIETVK